MLLRYISIAWVIVVATIWIRSYWKADRISLSWHPSKGMAAIADINFANQATEVSYFAWRSGDTDGNHIEWEVADQDPQYRYFEWRSIVAKWSISHHNTLGIYEEGQAFGHLCVPDWFVMLISICCVMPWWILRRKSKRTAGEVGCCLCPVCGYDVRATLTRCPECGYILGV